MRTNDILKGGTIELEVKYNGKSMSLNSDVIMVKNDYVLITCIKINNQNVGFSDKLLVNFLYKLDSKVFIWENVKVSLVTYENEICHKVDLVGDGKAYNRRGAFRIYVGEEMPVYVNSVKGPAALMAMIKDISETGFSFIAKEDIDVSRMVRLKLRETNPVISLSAVIVRREPLENIDAILYGCKFNETNNYLSKYVARLQAEALKKKSAFTPLLREKPSLTKELISQ